jgi:hypothetical protein
MAKEIQSSLPDKPKTQLLEILEREGKSKWLKRWKEHMAFPENLNPVSSSRDEQEKVLRYLLPEFLVVLSQQNLTL